MTSTTAKPRKSLAHFQANGIGTTYMYVGDAGKHERPSLMGSDRVRVDIAYQHDVMFDHRLNVAR
jgi:hypothetical protein